MHNRHVHFCRYCATDFHIAIDVEECGDFYLECPTCGEKHYRHFRDGVAVHCDFKRRKKEPVTLKAKRV